MERIVLLERLSKLKSQSDIVQEQLIAIQAEINAIYCEIKNPEEQLEAVVSIMPNLIEEIRKLPLRSKHIETTHYEFNERSLTEIQEEVEDTSSQINEKFPSRADSSEDKYFVGILQYISEILEIELPSRYQMASEKEANMETISWEKVNRSYQRKQEVEIIQEEPYIGRIDFYDLEDMQAQSYYIGERTFADENSDLLVVRWSDDRANIFYENEVGKAVENKNFGRIKLDYLRKIDTKDKQLKLYPPQIAGVDDAALISSLDSKRGSVDDMELITATISRSQNRLIRSELNKLMIIQGSAGTGKSIIALYRISYILDKYRDKLRENSIAFFGPNNLFLKHISSALKGLGNEKITKVHIDEYLKQFLRIDKIHDEKYSENMGLKGTISYKNYIEAYTEYLLTNIKPWLDPLIFQLGDKQIIISGVDVALAYENTLASNYKERANMLLNSFKQQYNDALQVLTAIEKQLSSFSRQYSKELFAKQMSTVNNASSLDDFDELFKLETIRQVTTTANFISRENKKLSNDFVASAISKQAQDHQRLAIKLVSEDLGNYFRGIRNSVEEQIKLHYRTWVKEQYKDQIENLITYEQIQAIKETISRTLLDESTSLYIEKIEDIINVSKLEEMERNTYLQFIYDVENKRKKIVDSIIDKTKEHLLDLFYDEAEKAIQKRLKEIILQTYKVRIGLKEDFRFSNPPKDTKSEIINEYHVETINQFIQNRIFNLPQDIYKEIRNDSLQMSAKLSNPSELPFVSNKITKFDLPALLLIMKMMHGTGFRAPLQYAIVDEAQDLWPFSVWAIRQLVSTDGLILFGDLGQNLNKDNPIETWKEYASLLGKVDYYNLDTNFRSTKEIFNYSNSIIKPFAEGKYQLPTKAFLTGEKVREYVKGTFNYRVILEEEINRGISHEKSYETITILCHDEKELNILKEYLANIPSLSIQHLRTTEMNNEKHRLLIMTVEEAKGLQFDYVIIPNYNSYKTSDYDRKLLYVAVSRALHELVVLNTKV